MRELDLLMCYLSSFDIFPNIGFQRKELKITLKRRSTQLAPQTLSINPQCPPKAWISILNLAFLHIFIMSAVGTMGSSFEAIIVEGTLIVESLSPVRAYAEK